MSGKFGSGYLVSAAAEPELFQALSLARAFQSGDEKKAAYTFSSVEYDGRRHVVRSTDGCKSIEISVDLPMEMAGFFGGRAVVKIHRLGASHLFIPYQDFSDGINFPDCAADFPEIEFMESVRLDIPSKKEGETYADTAGGAFSRAAYEMQRFIDRPVAFHQIEMFQKMGVEVCRDPQERFRGRFVVKSENESFAFTAVMAALERLPLDAVPAEKLREAMDGGGYEERGRVIYTPKLSDVAKRAARKRFA